jgi:hypothetical protein
MALTYKEALTIAAASLRIDVDRHVSMETSARQNLSVDQINANAWARQLGVMAAALLQADQAREQRVREKRQLVNDHIDALSRRIVAYENALLFYPAENPHQLQARKICEGITEFAKKVEAGLTPIKDRPYTYIVTTITDKESSA